MGFLKLFSQKEKPNYKTVDTLNNLKVVDVVSMNDLGSAVNADNRFLMKSGTAYWNMEVPHLSAEKNPGTAKKPILPPVLLPAIPACLILILFLIPSKGSATADLPIRNFS